MVAALAWGAWGELWSLNDNVSIDGPAKTITIHPLVTTISTVEVYSAWIRWLVLYDHLKYEPAIRTVGGDILPGSQLSGVFFFLINGWQIVVDHNVTVDGIIYHDDPGTLPFLVLPGGGVTNKVAALAYAYVAPAPSLSSADITAITTSVWEKPISSFTDKSTLGGFIAKSLLTVSKFIGLK